MNLDLFKKEDILVLLDSFSTSFLQEPMKRLPKSLAKYTPKGFRPEKLARNQLIKTYTDALSAGEGSLAEYLFFELNQHFKIAGTDKLVESFKDKDMTNCAKIIEVSINIIECGLAIHPHTVLMLYGINCTEEEKKLSLRLQTTIMQQLEEEKQHSYDDGVAKGGSSVVSDLEAETKKCNKLTKTVERITATNEELTKENKRLTGINEELSKSVEKKSKKIIDLTAEKDSLEIKVEKLKEELHGKELEISLLEDALNDKRCEIISKSDQIESLINQISSKVLFSTDEIKEMCENAISLFKCQDKENILELAKKKFSQSVNVQDAWKSLCADSVALINEIFKLLSSNSFEMIYYDKFAELEALLLLESAIEQALKSMAHKVMATTPSNNSIVNKITVQ